MLLSEMFFTRFWCDIELKRWGTMNTGEEMWIRNTKSIMSKVRARRTGVMMVVGGKMGQEDFEEEVDGGVPEEGV